MCAGNHVCQCKKLKVYRVDTWSPNFCGYSLVAAESAEEATKIVKEFISNNGENARGYYSHVKETNQIKYIFSTKKGMIFEGIELLPDEDNE